MKETKKPKRQKLPEPVRRAAILEAAHKLFNQRGYQQARMEDVAAAAGLTKGGLYFHFKDKRSLFEAVVLDCIERIDQIILELNSRNLNPESKLSEFFSAMIQELAGDFQDQSQDSYPGAVEMFFEGHRMMFTKGEIRKIYQRVRGFMRENIEQGVREGFFSPRVQPEVSAAGAVAMWVGIYLQYASDPKSFDLGEVAQGLCGIFLEGLRGKVCYVP